MLEGLADEVDGASEVDVEDEVEVVQAEGLSILVQYLTTHTRWQAVSYSPSICSQLKTHRRRRRYAGSRDDATQRLARLLDPVGRPLHRSPDAGRVKDVADEEPSCRGVQLLEQLLPVLLVHV